MTARARLPATDLGDRRPLLVVPDSAVGGKPVTINENRICRNGGSLIIVSKYFK
jgi:hypothetical protein